MDLGAKIQKLREAKGITKYRLAEITGISHTIYAISKTDPRFRQLKQSADFWNRSEFLWQNSLQRMIVCLVFLQENKR